MTKWKHFGLMWEGTRYTVEAKLDGLRGVVKLHVRGEGGLGAFYDMSGWSAELPAGLKAAIGERLGEPIP